MLPYHIYLLTCWQDNESDVELRIWRFRLEEPRTGEHQGFDNLEELVVFLKTKLADSEDDQGNGKCS